MRPALRLVVALALAGCSGVSTAGEDLREPGANDGGGELAMADGAADGHLPIGTPTPTGNPPPPAGDDESAPPVADAGAGEDGAAPPQDAGSPGPDAADASPPLDAVAPVDASSGEDANEPDANDLCFTPSTFAGDTTSCTALPVADCPSCNPNPCPPCAAYPWRCLTQNLPDGGRAVLEPQFVASSRDAGAAPWALYTLAVTPQDNGATFCATDRRCAWSTVTSLGTSTTPSAGGVYCPPLVLHNGPLPTSDDDPTHYPLPDGYTCTAESSPAWGQFWCHQ
ncbi:MAG TPA: hypothetical protein VGI39_05015 [Polyangiaceae bacterium]|jgi:hypothetical protein